MAHEQAQSRAGRPASERAIMALIQDTTSNADTVQHTILSQILAQNSNSEYLRCLLSACAADGRSSGDECPLMQPHTFKRIAPLSSYEQIQRHIQRISDGETGPILTDCPVIELVKSSGTSSGMHKLFPAIEADLERRHLLAFAASSIVDRAFEGMEDGKHALFQFVNPRRRTAGGLLTQPLLNSYFFSPEAEQLIRARYTSPIEVVLGCEDVKQNIYCQLLCALLRREEVVRFGTVFASGLIHVLHVLENKWRELVNAIRTGSLNEKEVSDPKVRKGVERQIEGPDPALAMQVEEECCRQPLWQGIIRRLWPRAKCVQCAVTGSMEQYIPMLEVSYTFLPNMAYFEFLLLQAADEDDNEENSIHQSQLVDLVNVKLGQEYEVVVTTFAAGLYRYRVGDCVQVTGFHKAPQFRLLGRKNVVLSIGIEKTDDATLHKAVCTAKVRHLEARSSCQLVGYTSYTDISAVPGHYVLFWEVRGRKLVEEAIMEPSLEPSVMEACCDTVEECLDAMYQKGKGSWIGPLEIRVVRQGTFHELMEYITSLGGASLGQYKTPRVVKLAPHLQLLNSRVSHSFLASS
ncbi:hypothetical protein L7F22_001320 [Adiantum nelumboides]|nr:hypothetical protein [Adiantum nelumboides]